ncbi:MAG: helix-turn-helix transcriptional regulator [Brasilonema octagenarum HA4186-MV1]|jgi:putative transcriptional regulator|nr:helix-turn-helix transcriptional regulator [Brasilonema octagenarum HA4186-MV1]
MADRGFSNKALAREISFHEVTISKLKSSKLMPYRLERETLERLCTALQCQPSELLSWHPTTETEEEPEHMGQSVSSTEVETTIPQKEKKNSKVLKAKAKKARNQNWEELRMPLKMTKVKT